MEISQVRSLRFTGEMLMPRTAKGYIALVLGSGTVILFLAARWWSSESLKQFVIFLGFTLFASTLKVRIPGITSTISPNFAFLLTAMAFFSFSQVVVAALCAALVQSFWRPTSRPRTIQVLFSAGALVLSSSFAFTVSRLIVRPLGGNDAPLALLAGSLYLLMNTALVSIVVGLTERQPLKRVFQRCYEWVFPYFAFGIVVIGLMSGSFPTMTAWQSSLQVMPAMVCAYLYFLGRSKKQAESTAVNDEVEELLALSSLER
jgi:hypothetical protein